MFTTLETFDTIFSADSVEWCPIDGYNDLFVCGTYELIRDENEQREKRSEKGPQERQGKIFLFRILSLGKLQLIQQIDIAAVLDMKWAHVKCGNHILLGVVNSIGYLQIYKLLANEEEQKIELLVEKKLRVTETEILALSLDWNIGKGSRCDNYDNGVENAQIIVSDSKGWVSLFHFSNNNLDVIQAGKFHDHEAWITSFDYYNSYIIYSGGDDCKLQRFDSRVGLLSTGCNRVHGAGVTSLHSNANEEFCLASGSYDEILRLWDTRNFRHPISETNMAGGIWRLKWDPFYSRYLFAACMYGGFQIVDCEKKECPVIIGEYNEHKSIAYGCDWSFLSSEKILNDKHISTIYQKTILAATCSFYDHTLKLSAININN